ncbi:MAG TPA: HlyD family secretion protein, partial [Enterobacteriaceae bacterium]|nr:HlyD family secretion protein [Enterobacteriaceae bacterium]
MSNTPGGASGQTFARFLTIGRQARAAKNAEELAYCIVNDSQALFAFRHTALVINNRVRAVTGVTQPAPHAPFVAFVERACGQLQKSELAEQCGVVPATALDQQSRDDWLALSAPEVLWTPLKDRQGRCFGGIW